MPLVTTREILKDADKKGYGVGGYDTCGGNIDFILSIISTAEEEKAPVIVQAGAGEMRAYNDMEYTAWMIREIAKRSTVPIALHLDHSDNFRDVVQAVKYGFTSVMIDASALPLDENITLTRKVVTVAQTVGVSIEAELGHITGVEFTISDKGEISNFTDPEEAVRFVRETGIDSLAVAIGTVHGFYQEEPKLKFELLQELDEKIDIPLVLHGSSGVPEADLIEAISLGIRKINIATSLRLEFRNGIRDYIESNPGDVYPLHILPEGRKRIKEFIRAQMRAWGCAGKA